MTGRTRRGARRWLAHGFAASLLAVGGTVGALAAAGPASAATTTINCDTAAQPSANWTSCQQLVGTAKCVWNNKDGTYTLAVGYTNPTAYNLYAVVPNTATNTAGPNNAFTATSGFAANPGHAATFYPGTYTTAWTVTWTPASKTDLVTWALMGHTYTWADTYTACPSKPVPVIGNGIAASMGVVAITGFGLLNRRRLREMLAATRLVATPSSL
ncbi:hypothetical protein acdb102_15320 [Acidothermaceae bacterium B102]|nr:hypothetical protein acdb102_15320 [Acidothermaceae bacterium B102]